MMNRHDFISDESLQANLNEVLKLPIVQLAFSIVRREGVARALPRAVPGVSYSELVSAAGSLAIGWQGSLDALESLTNRTMTQHHSVQQTTMYKSEAKKRMLESEQYTEEDIDEILKNM